MPSGFRLVGVDAPRCIRDFAPTADGQSIHFVSGGIDSPISLSLRHLPGQRREFTYSLRETDCPVFAFVLGRDRLGLLLEESDVLDNDGDGGETSTDQSVLRSRSLHRDCNRVGQSWERRPPRVGPMPGDLLAASQDLHCPSQLFVLTTFDYQETFLNISRASGSQSLMKQMSIPFPIDTVQDILPVRGLLYIAYDCYDFDSEVYRLNAQTISRFRFENPDKCEHVKTKEDPIHGFPNFKGHLATALDAIWALTEQGQGLLHLWRLDLDSLSWRRERLELPHRFHSPMFRTLASGKAFIAEQRQGPAGHKQEGKILSFWLQPQPISLLLCAFNEVAKFPGLASLHPNDLRSLGIPPSLVKWL